MEPEFKYDIEALKAAYRIWMRTGEIVAVQYAVDLDKLHEVIEALKKLRGGNAD